MMNQAEATFVLVDSLYVYNNQEAKVTQRLKNWFNVRQTSFLGKDILPVGRQLIGKWPIAILARMKMIKTAVCLYVWSVNVASYVFVQL